MNTRLEELIEAAKSNWTAFLNNGRPKVAVVLDTSSIAGGAEATLEALRAEFATRNLAVDVLATGSWGFCWMEPTLTVRSAAGTRTVLYANVTADRVPELVEKTIVQAGDLPELALGLVGGGPKSMVEYFDTTPRAPG